MRSLPSSSACMMTWPTCRRHNAHVHLKAELWCNSPLSVSPPASHVFFSDSRFKPSMPSLPCLTDADTRLGHISHVFLVSKTEIHLVETCLSFMQFDGTSTVSSHCPCLHRQHNPQRSAMIPLPIPSIHARRQVTISGSKSTTTSPTVLVQPL